MRRILNVFNALGLVIMFFSITLCLPIITAFFYHETAWWYFAEVGIGAFCVGLFLFLSCHYFKRELMPRDGILLVFLVWLTLTIVSALPLYLQAQDNGLTYITFMHSFYEAMSGLTTTGASAYKAVSVLPKAINLWRCTLIWFGGMGILVLAVAILPLIGVGGQQVIRNEASGPFKEDKLSPRIASTAKVLYSVYAATSFLCCILYKLSGMSWYDAWCHTASTMGCGGFSTKDGGFIEMNNPWAEFVCIIFMLFAGINFATHVMAIKKGPKRAYTDCAEAIPFLVLVLVSCCVVSLILFLNGTIPDPLQAIRHGFFNTISLATTSGFSSVDYLYWPVGISIWIFFLGGIATCAGSTGGGVKMIRLIIISKQIACEFKKLMHPNAVSLVKLGKKIVDSKIVSSILVFLIIYILTLFVLTTAILTVENNQSVAFSAIWANMNNIGPGFGSIGPTGNYADFSEFELGVCSLAMLLGRLEFFTVLVIFTPGFWKR